MKHAHCPNTRMILKAILILIYVFIPINESITHTQLQPVFVSEVDKVLISAFIWLLSHRIIRSYLTFDVART